MKISLLLTGNELMSGDTVDTNSNYLAQSLKDLGLVPYIKKVVGDDLALLVSSMRELAEVSDVLIVNGGLGPTRDDLTAVALSQASNNKIVRHPDALAYLSEWADKRGFMLTESNLKQVDLPDGCDIIDNPHGSAVGFELGLEACTVMCTPGVPSEFKPMVEDQVLPRVRKLANLSSNSKITRLRLFGITESGLQDMINAMFPDWPEQVELGFRVQLPVIEVKIATLGSRNEALNEEWTRRFLGKFSDYVIGRDSTNLTDALYQALLDKGVKLTTAESCTGGLIASGITSVAGSSEVFEAGFVTYSNAMKESLLGVSCTSLQKHGAVSEEVVLEMLSGALRVSGAEFGLAISGIAGPTGGTTEKPVGTVWIAWGSHEAPKARKFFLPIARQGFQRTACAISMDLLRRELLGLATDVDYYGELKRKSAMA